MKKTTCKNLRGACEEVITGNTAEEMGENSKKHVIQMIESGDEGHKQAVASMMELSPEDQQKWYQDFLTSFDSLEEA